jgi:predicted P-loop ATPase
VPYRLPELLASDVGKYVILLEGEKDANNLAQWGVTTTTFAQGAGKWRAEYAQYFEGRKVALIPDNDEPGRAHMAKIAQELYGIAAEIKIINLTGLSEKQDISDWMQLETSNKKVLGSLVTSAMPWAPVNPPVVIGDDTGSTGISAIKYGHIDWPDQTDKGRPLSTIRNIEKLLEIYGVTAKYNAVKKEMQINIPGSRFTVDNASNCALSELKSHAAAHRLPTADIAEFIAYLADQHTYNPVAYWIESKPWDGVDRFPSLVTSLDPVDMVLAGKLLWRWLLSAVVAVFNPDGVAAGGVLVLQGDQYIGKTSWFWSLTKHNREWAKEGVMLNPADKDSVMQSLSYWMVELGELDATFRRSDIAALKAFITKDFDQLRRPYARGDSRYPRRTVFAASVNPKEYLHDDTGNRRFWTISCGKNMNARHGIDMQQLWAQVFVAYKKGEPHLLTKDEHSMLNTRNEEYSAMDPVEEMIISHYDWGRNIGQIGRTATEVLIEIGFDKPSKIQKNAASAALRKLSGAESVRSSGGRRVFMVPFRADGSDQGPQGSVL